MYQEEKFFLLAILEASKSIDLPILLYVQESILDTFSRSCAVLNNASNNRQEI